MSNLIASNYRSSATGYLPALNPIDTIESVSTGGSLSVPGAVSNGTTLATTAISNLYFNPTFTPPVGALKNFVTGTGTSVVYPATGVTFIQGNSTPATAVNTITMLTANRCQLQFVGVNGSGNEVYRVIHYTGGVTLT